MVSKMPVTTAAGKTQAANEVLTLQKGSAWEASRIGRYTALLQQPVNRTQQLGMYPSLKATFQ